MLSDQIARQAVEKLHNRREWDVGSKPEPVTCSSSKQTNNCVNCSDAKVPVQTKTRLVTMTYPASGILSDGHVLAGGFRPGTFPASNQTSSSESPWLQQEEGRRIYLIFL